MGGGYPTEARPSSYREPAQEPSVALLSWLPRRPAGNAGAGGSASSGLMRKALVPGSWGDPLLLLAAGRAWGAGHKQAHRILGALSLRAGPASALLPQGYVWGGPESTLSQMSPLIKKQKASLSEKSRAGSLVGEAALSRLRRSCQPFAQG